MLVEVIHGRELNLIKRLLKFLSEENEIEKVIFYTNILSCMNEYFADANGIKLCYKEYGDKDSYPIIGIHGFGSKKETWIAQVGELSKDYRVIIYDQRGAGKSDRPDKPPYTMDMFIDDIKGLMDYLNIEKTHILGRSMGGMIAQAFCVKYPEKVNKLLLITTGPGGKRSPAGSDVFKNNQIERTKKIQINPEKVFWKDTRFGFYVKFRKEMMADPKKKFYGIWSVEDLIKYIQDNPPRPQDITNFINVMNTQNVFDKLDQIKNKTLVLSASHDKMVPKAAGEYLSTLLPNCIFKVIEEAGHECHYSRAPEVNKIILDFLNN